MSVSWNILAGCVRMRIVFAENSFTTEDRGHRGKIGRKQVILNLVYIHFLLCPSKNRYKLNRKTYYIYFIIQKITTFVV